MNLSGVVIVKNGEELIEDCLKSLSFCDEIVVIDGGSSDNTHTIAKKITPKIFIKETKDFSEMRNEGLKKSKGKWILYLDADERVSADLSKEIIQKIKGSGEYAAFRVPRQNYYLGKNSWPYKEYLERLFKKDKIKKWYGKIHESPEVNGRIGDLQNIISHYTHRNLETMVAKTIDWSKIEAQLRYDSHHPQMKWWRFPRVMTNAFINSYIKQQGWKAGTVGIIESMYQAFSIFITYARLWEIQRNNEKQ